MSHVADGSRILIFMVLGNIFFVHELSKISKNHVFHHLGRNKAKIYEF